MWTIDEKELDTKSGRKYYIPDPHTTKRRKRLKEERVGKYKF